MDVESAWVGEVWSFCHLIEIISIVKETLISNHKSNPKSENVIVGRSNEVLCWDLTRLFNFLRAHAIEWLEGILFFFLNFSFLLNLWIARFFKTRLPASFMYVNEDVNVSVCVCVGQKQLSLLFLKWQVFDCHVQNKFFNDNSGIDSNFVCRSFFFLHSHFRFPFMLSPFTILIQYCWMGILFDFPAAKYFFPMNTGTGIVISNHMTCMCVLCLFHCAITKKNVY